MGKNKRRFNPLKECKNYAVQCGIANNCNNCKSRVMGVIFDKNTNTKREGVVCCKKGLDIRDHAHKGECFECKQEGALQCKQD